MNLESHLVEGNCVICKKLYKSSNLKQHSTYECDFYNTCIKCGNENCSNKLNKDLFSNKNYKTKYRIKCKVCSMENIIEIYGFKNLGNIDLLSFMCKCKTKFN